MEIKLNVQKNGENLIKERLIKESELKPQKAYFFMGDIKESGFEILEDCLIDLKARKLIVIGINRKNTTKKMLDTLYNYTKSVYLFNNNEMVEFDSNIVVFEHEKKATIFLMNSDVTESSFTDNIATYTEIIYDLEIAKDMQMYKEYISNLVSISKLENAIKLEKSVIKELFDNNQIFTVKQYTHNVMTIAELLGEKKVENKSDNVEIEDTDVIGKERIDIPKVNLSDIEDFSIDIDIDDSIQREDSIVEKVIEKEEAKAKEEIEEQPVKKLSEDLMQDTEEFEISDDVLDIEGMLFEKADIELDTKSIKEKISDSEKIASERSATKKVDLTKVSNLIMELPKKPSKGRDVSCIKIPNYIKDMIPGFFDVMNKYRNIEIAGAKYKETKVKLEIVNVKSYEKYSDISGKILSKAGQTYITFSSEYLTDIAYDENDIVRIIKLSNDIYHIEIISKDVEEYKIWKKLCATSLKGSSRSYGVM